MILEEIFKKLVKKVFNQNIWKTKTSFIIIDNQSVKNSDIAEEKKILWKQKISEIKFYIVVNSIDFSIIVTKENFPNGSLSLFSDHIIRNKFVQFEIPLCPVKIIKRNELHTFYIIPKI